MGKTRTRVTFLVLSLEAIGLGMLALSIYLAGGLSLTCEQLNTPGLGAAEGGSAPLAAPQESGPGPKVICEASERRLLWLVTFQRRTYPVVLGAVADTPALGRSDHWLSLVTPAGRERVLAGGARRTAADVARLDAFISAPENGAISLYRSAAPWALGAAVFGCLWIFVISLIMREFLGYYTPWWWRAFRGPKRRRDGSTDEGQTEGVDLA